MLEGGDVLCSDDEQDELEGLDFGKGEESAETQYVLNEQQINDIFAYISDLDAKTRKLVGIFATQIAIRAASMAVEVFTREKRKQPPIVS